MANRVKLKLAIETADNHIIEGADSLTRMPDGVFALTWDSDDFYLMASLLATDLRASFENGPTESAVGLGGSLSGKLELPLGSYNDDFLFSVTFGKGIGSHFNDAAPDAVFDTSDSSLKAIKVLGVTLGYKHGWNSTLNSTFTYGCVDLENEAAQSPDSVDHTEYASSNLVWNMNTHWLLGVEGLWGKRRDIGGAKGTDFRTQFTSRLSF